MFFFLEETSFYRDPSTEQIAHGHSVPSTHAHVAESETNSEHDKKDEAAVSEQPHGVPIDPTARLARTPWPGPRFWRFSKPHPYSGGIMLRGLVQPILLLRNPILLWCALQFGMYQVYWNCEPLAPRQTMCRNSDTQSLPL